MFKSNSNNFWSLYQRVSLASCTNAPFSFHPLLKFTSDALDAANRSEVTVACLLDTRKAFDSVCHHGLIFKLIQLKFSIPLSRTIHSYLSDRTFYVANKSKTLEIGDGLIAQSCLTYSQLIPTQNNNATMLLYIAHHRCPLLPTRSNQPSC